MINIGKCLKTSSSRSGTACRGSRHSLPRLPSTERPTDPEVETDEVALRQLLADPRLAGIPLSKLGLKLEANDDLPDYPFLRSAPGGGSEKNFVFIPAASVDVKSSPSVLSIGRRKELVFSTIAARQLKTLLERIDQPSITLAYYISCSDFIYLVSPQPLTERRFSPLQSFVDRTNFTETRAASGVRESQPYLDLSGGGFVRTYSAFVENRALGACGMLAVDRNLQPLADYWQNVRLGTRGGALRDFTFASYSLASREIEPQEALPRALGTQVAATLASWDDERLRGGIGRFAVKNTQVFTVPIGDNSVGLFVFDAEAMRRKYYLILAGGFVLIVGFVWMVALTARGHRAAAAAEQLQEKVLENLHGGFVIVDRKGSILGSTDRFRQMVGDARAEGTIDRFLAPASAAEYRKLAYGGSFEFAGNCSAVIRAPSPQSSLALPSRCPAGATSGC